MSSIRFYILSALDRQGPMHGHALVALAEQEHVHEWTDISVGGLYGAARRLAADGLIEQLRTEKHGNYPERQIFAITDTGRKSLRIMRHKALTELSWRHDPVDLALWSLDPDRLDELEDVVRDRRDQIATILEDQRAHRISIRKYLSEAEWLGTRHGIHRLEAELAWHDELLAAIPEIIRDERTRTKAQP
ncbi:PadR family transcriptional regulator [Rarobacter faecitabidus]|uniref:PadR family transcriptional regulator n=1 Tax=Rarobacter faecitabidus TaxID=13243 RepID=A0A542ZP91_RARFA|nr:PadR family transcriptional regulator [Rarobacter faecitabidus]TQL62191.1 PadR family transcriptional regulator [Rarobacter faecitabidus]